MVKNNSLLKVNLIFPTIKLPNGNTTTATQQKTTLDLAKPTGPKELPRGPNGFGTRECHWLMLEWHPCKKCRSPQILLGPAASFPNAEGRVGPCFAKFWLRHYRLPLESMHARPNARSTKPRTQRTEHQPMPADLEI
jgi:hypothetical protein